MSKKPSEFIWCGVHFIQGRSEAYLRSEPFVGELMEKINTFSGVYENDSGFTLDVVWQGRSQIVRDETYDGMRIRGSYKQFRELGDEQVFLKPDTDSLGPQFVQIVVGDIEFLIAASRELLSEDGWPETLSSDIEEAVNFLTADKNILCFIRPHIREPLFISVLKQSAHVGDPDQYWQ